MTGTSFSAELQKLLAAGMGQELHWFPEDVPLHRLAAVLVSMANTSGGRVVLGVSPRSGLIEGLVDPEAALDKVFQAAVLVDPPLVLPVPQMIHMPESPHPIGLVTVPPGLPNVYSIDGSYLGREGRQVNPLSARRLRQLLMERGIVQFDSRVPPQATLADLDPDQISAYVALLRSRADGLRLAPLGERESTVLVRRGCIQQTPEGLVPTYAGLLLFGRYPQQWLPNAFILAARFAGSGFTDRFIKKEIAGSLPEQLLQAEVFARENMPVVTRLSGLVRQEGPQFPPEAVRELLVNAAAHRDYNLQGDSIHLNLFADRLEVQSPGGLPGPVNLNNLLEARFSRNPVIAQVLSDMGFVEKLGYGLDRVVAVMRQNGLRFPRFEEVAGCFKVSLFGVEENDTVSLPDLTRYQSLDLNPRQQSAVGYMALHGRITNSTYQELCSGISSESLRRDLSDLAKRGIIIKVGDKRATYYILKK
jgi:ATP-dependent DNA helicase RecG